MTMTGLKLTGLRGTKIMGSISYTLVNGPHGSTYMAPCGPQVSVFGSNSFFSLNTSEVFSPKFISEVTYTKKT
jgi:hypothetical protein